MKTRVILSKVALRLKKITKRIVPHNTHFKPYSICNTHPDAADALSSEIKVHEIYPNYVTTLDISEELYQACSEYWKPKRQAKTDYILVEAPNGRIYTDHESSVAIISKYNRLVENVSLTLKDGKATEASFNNIFEQRYFSAPVKFKGTVFSMLSGGAGLNNIGHWFLDVLPRLHLLEKSGLLNTVDWFLVPSTRYSYQTETLELLGIPSEKIISSEDYTHITADSIIASSAPRGNDTLVPQWLITYIRSAFLATAPQDAKTKLENEGPFIYISRSDSSIRNVLNENELQDVLQQYGFKTIISSGHSIAEKIRMFSKAKLVLSPTGAGLISMLFCQPGTKLVEIFNEGFVIEPFYDIATKLDLDYRYIICKSSNGKKSKNATQAQKEHLLVETQKVEQMLKQITN